MSVYDLLLKDMFSFYILLLCSFLLYSWWVQTHGRQRKFKMPPDFPNSLPIIGISHLLFSKDTKSLLNIGLKLGQLTVSQGGVVCSKLGPFRTYFITDPDDCVTVLNDCLEKNWIYEFSKAWVGEGLISVTSNMDKWKRHRKIINPAFNQHKLNGYVDIFNKQAKQLVKDLAAKGDKSAFDHSHLLDDMLLRTMYQTIMGFNEEEVQDFVNETLIESIKTMFIVMTRRIQCFWWHSQFLYNFSSLKKKEDKAIVYLHEMSHQIIKKKRLILNKEGEIFTKHKSLLELLLELPAEVAFTDQEIREEVDTMVVAGSDTSATTLIYAFMLIGSHQDIQEKVYQELREVFEDSLRDVEKHDLPKLVFMEAVLMETLRLYPVVPFFGRYIAKDVKIKKYTLQAGSTCVMCAYNMHRDPAVWGPDAAEFHPERWIPNPPAAARAFLGFSLGRRGCIGKAFGMMSMKTTLAHVLRHYSITADITKLELKVDALLKPASGCEIFLKTRK